MKKRTFITLLTLGGMCLLWTACTSPVAPPAAPAIDPAAVTAQLQAMEDAYAAAYMKRDPDAVMNYYADDLVSYAREKEPAQGKAALRQRMAEGMAKDTLGTTPSFKVIEVFAGTDHVTEIGAWTDTDAKGVVKDHGTYFSVFRKTGDQWLCIRDISVSAMPKDTTAKTEAVQ